MKRKSLITLLGLAPFAIGLVSCASAVSVQSSAEDIGVESKVPPGWLNIDSTTHCLKGFAHGITVEKLREAGYTTLEIPAGVTSIDHYAFAYMFDGRSNKINKIILNRDLEEIGIGSFTNCYGLTTIDNLAYTKLISIGQDAFFYCTDLNGSLYLPTTLKTIGDNAFKYCDNFSGTLQFPTSIESIGSHAFDRCSRIAQLDFSKYDKIPAWLCQKNNMFHDLASSKELDKREILFDIGVNDESEWKAILKDRQGLDWDNFTISPLKTTTEANFTFEDDAKTIITGIKNYVGLNAVKIPSSVKKITEIHLPGIKPKYKLILNDGLEEIANKAFYQSQEIGGNILLPTSLKSMGIRAFEGTNISGKIELPSGITELSANCFAQTKIQSITLTKSIKTLGSNCFTSCNSLDEIDVSSFTSPSDIPDLWKNKYDKDEQPFWNFAEGTRPTKGIILISDSVGISDQWVSKFKSLGMDDVFVSTKDRDWALYVKTRLQNPLPDETADKAYAIKNNNEIVGLSKAYKDDSDFPSMYGLIKTPDKINKIADDAFNGTKQFQSKKSQAFTDCPDLITPWYISFNVGLISIGKNAFKNCTGLTGRLVLPSTLATVGDSAFDGCTELLNVNLPSSLTYIGNNAFKDTGFSTIKLPASLKYVGNGAFNSNNIRTIDLTEYGTSYQLNWLPPNGTNDQIFNIQPACNKGKIIVSGNTALWQAELLKYGLNNQWEIVNEEGGI